MAAAFTFLPKKTPQAGAGLPMDLEATQEIPWQLKASCQRALANQQ